jgi:hypothetical protein
MNSRLKLPLSFDPEPLRSDLDQLASGDWVTHFNKHYFEGQWTGVVLRSVNPNHRTLYPDPHAKAAFAPTPILDRCPNTRALLESFHCSLKSVRFLRLAAGSIILEHRDYNLGLDENQVRLHIPVVTNHDVVFFLDAQRVEMNPGECWYLDLSLPHWVENRSALDRVHLVIDCEVNEWLRQLLASAEGDEMAPVNDEGCSIDELERFRLAVLADFELQQQLRVTADWESFARLAVSIGNERGYRFSESQVHQALLAARQDWLSRWID